MYPILKDLLIVINGKTGQLRQKRLLEIFYIKYFKNLKLNRKKVGRSPKIY